MIQHKLCFEQKEILMKQHKLCFEQKQILKKHKLCLEQKETFKMKHKLCYEPVFDVNIFCYGDVPFVQLWKKCFKHFFGKHFDRF
jgi:hypothetical protein